MLSFWDFGFLFQIRSRIWDCILVFGDSQLILYMKFDGPQRTLKHLCFQWSAAVSCNSVACATFGTRRRTPERFHIVILRCISFLVSFQHLRILTELGTFIPSQKQNIRHVVWVYISMCSLIIFLSARIPCKTLFFDDGTMDLHDLTLQKSVIFMILQKKSVPVLALICD